MIHIDPATLRRRPIIGVLFGGATAAVVVFLVLAGWPEVSALLQQKSPVAVSHHQLASMAGIRWVTLTDGEWHCDQAIILERGSGLERWVRGPVETTEIPITGATGGELVVASFDGALKCDERAGAPLTGVVGSTEIFTSRAALRRWAGSADRVVVLNVGASPRWAVIMLLGLIGIALLAFGFAGYYLMILLRSREPPAARLPATEPIQPS